MFQIKVILKLQVCLFLNYSLVKLYDIFLSLLFWLYQITEWVTYNILFLSSKSGKTKNMMASDLVLAEELFSRALAMIYHLQMYPYDIKEQGYPFLVTSRKLIIPKGPLFKYIMIESWGFWYEFWENMKFYP